VHIHNKGNSTLSHEVKGSVRRQSMINLILNEHNDRDNNGPSTNMKGWINGVAGALTRMEIEDSTLHTKD
jgi:hypothetical protein